MSVLTVLYTVVTGTHIFVALMELLIYYHGVKEQSDKAAKSVAVN